MAKRIEDFLDGPLYVSQEELESEEARVEELRDIIADRKKEVERVRGSISSLEGWQTRETDRIDWLRGDIAKRAVTIREYLAEKAVQEGIAERGRGVVDRWYARRVAARLGASIGSYRGWQTTRGRELEGLIKSVADREERILRLYVRVKGIMEELRSDALELAYETERLARKVVREYLILEFTKYFEYKAKKRGRGGLHDLNVEVRGTSTFSRDELSERALTAKDFSVLWPRVERILDYVMSVLFDPTLVSESTITQAGVEQVDTTEEPWTYMTVVIIDKETGKTWRARYVFKTETVTEEFERKR